MSAFPGHTFSTNELKSELERDQGPLKLSHFPWWTMTLAAPFWELARGLATLWADVLDRWVGGYAMSISSARA